MKKIFLFLTITLFSIPAMYAVVTWDGTSSEIWTQGTGTEADPYLIETPANLAYLSTQVKGGELYTGKYFLQTDDFDLQSKAWTSIGTSTYKFEGNYDGGKKYISNLSASIFGYTNNVTIKNVIINGIFSSYSSPSTLIIETQGVTMLHNCQNLATIKFTSGNATGGLVSSVTGTSILMENCSNEGELKRTIYGNPVTAIPLGGLIGRVSAKAIIKNCHNKGEVYLSVSTSNLSGISSYVGGLIGMTTSDATFIQCSNNGKVNSNASFSLTSGNIYTYICAYAGGLLSSCSAIATYEQCYCKGNIVATADYSYDHTKEISTTYGLGPGTSQLGCYTNATMEGEYTESTKNGKCSYNATNKRLYDQFGDASTCTEEKMKSPYIIPILNVIDDYFTIDLEGINDGYPILKWQAGPRFTITGSCDANRGTVKGGGEYAPGNTVTLTATPKKGCTFVGWSDGNTDNPRTVTVEGDATYIAQFTKSNYTIYVNQDCTNYIE